MAKGPIERAHLTVAGTTDMATARGWDTDSARQIDDMNSEPTPISQLASTNIPAACEHAPTSRVAMAVLSNHPDICAQRSMPARQELLGAV
jgi:hypothetical protein